MSGWTLTPSLSHRMGEGEDVPGGCALPKGKWEGRNPKSKPENQKQAKACAPTRELKLAGAVFRTYTGSKEHNIWLSSMARRRGMEWKAKSGLFESGKRIAPTLTPALSHRIGEGGELRNFTALEEQESEVYAALGLPWIPPSDRENEKLRRLTTR